MIPYCSHVLRTFHGSSFQSDVDSFIEENCKLFKSTSIYLDDATGGVELENVGVREHTHEHMDCFGRFTSMFDKNLDNFLKSKSISKRDFMKICQRSYQSAQEDGQDNMGTMLVDLLLATSEYDTLRYDVKRIQERHQKGDFGDDETLEEGKCSRDGIFAP